MLTMQQLPLAPPWANEELKGRAHAAANMAYLRVFAEARLASQKFAHPIVSTAHLPIAHTMKGRALQVLLLKAGFVKLGRCRCVGGYTTMYAQKEMASLFASPTDAYKAFMGN